jgi:MFS family permease
MDRVPSIENVAIGIAVWATGTVIGPFLGAYMLIVFGWFFGVLVGVWRLKFDPDDHSRRIKTAWFVAVSFGVTVGGASLGANLLAPQLHRTPFELLFFVAFGIPAVGHTWLTIAKWVGGIVRRRFDQRFREPQ